jgi:hypothetical protein
VGGLHRSEKARSRAGVPRDSCGWIFDRSGSLGCQSAQEESRHQESPKAAPEVDMTP